MADTEHNTITDPEIHEPKGVAAANSGEIYIANGAGSGLWTPEPLNEKLSSANAGEILVADGVGDGAFIPFENAAGATHAVSYISNNSQAVTIATGGAFQQVDHASITWVNLDAEGHLTWDGTNHWFVVSGTGAGHYRVHCHGAWTGDTTNDVMQFGVSVGPAVSSANTLNTGRLKEQLPTSSIRSHYAFGGTFYVAASDNDLIAPMVTTTTNGATVTIVDLHMYIELVHTS